MFGVWMTQSPWSAGFVAVSAMVCACALGLALGMRLADSFIVQQ